MKTLGNPDDQQEIMNRLAGLCPEDKRQWGKMSVHQMICHLRDSYCVALGERTTTAATGLPRRTLIKWIALWAPFHWVKGFPTRPEVEQGKGGSSPTDFESDKNSLALVVSRFAQELRPPCFPHPVFGPMKVSEWWRWGYLHADHHLRQFGR